MPLRSKRPTAEINRLMREREAWALGQRRCWGCGCRSRLETHEIVRRSETSDWRHSENYTRLCDQCHAEAHGGYLTKDVLLTLKLLFDPAAFSVEWVREHALSKHWSPGALPEQCRWFIEE